MASSPRVVLHHFGNNVSRYVGQQGRPEANLYRVMRTEAATGARIGRVPSCSASAAGAMAGRQMILPSSARILIPVRRGQVTHVRKCQAHQKSFRWHYELVPSPETSG